MNTHHQLHILAVGEISYGFIDPFGHAGCKDVAPQSQGIAQHIGRQQDNRALIKSECLAQLLAADGGCILPEASPFAVFPGACTRILQSGNLLAFGFAQGLLAARLPQLVDMLAHDNFILR